MSLSICAVLLGVAANAAAFSTTEQSATGVDAPAGVTMGPGAACAYFSGGSYSCWAANNSTSRIDGLF